LRRVAIELRAAALLVARLSAEGIGECFDATAERDREGVLRVGWYFDRACF
jgi:hypothetical protein